MVITKCYGEEHKFKTRKEAIKFYFGCINMSEGAERERYLNIYIQLMNGKDICNDEVTL